MEESERYERQVALPQIGESGQAMIRNGRVLVVGAGGLGCPALQYLAAAGVGQIFIVDFDKIEATNLNRQILFTPADIGRYKAEVARERLSALNPDISITAIPRAYSQALADELLPKCDVVLDCTDRPDVRYLINDTCVQHDKPFVYAGIYRFEGQLAVFNYRGSATYRCAFPEPENPKISATCADNGVLGTVPGILGTMQANEAIKILGVKDEVIADKLLIFNFISNSMKSIKLTRNAEAKVRGEHLGPIRDITPEALNARIESGEKFHFVDVREPHEQTAPEFMRGQNLPMSRWDAQEAIKTLEKSSNVVLYCQHGIRSRAAINSLPGELRKNILNLQGGLSAYLQQIQTIE